MTWQQPTETKWATNPLSDTENPSPAGLVTEALKLTSGVSRPFVFFNPMAELQVTQACLAAQSKPNNYKGSAFEFCQDVFYQCDKIIVDTKSCWGDAFRTFHRKKKMLLPGVSSLYQPQTALLQ